MRVVAVADSREWLPLHTRVRTVGGERIVLLGARDYSGVGQSRLISLALDDASPVVGYLDRSAARGKSRGEWWFLRSSLDDYRAQASGYGLRRALIADARARAGGRPQ